MTVVSPELVLVDPDLAAWCRLRLCEEAAAAEARRAQPKEIPPAAVVSVRANNTVERRSVARSVPRLSLLVRESVLVTAAVLLLAASGAASRPTPSAPAANVGGSAPSTPIPPRPGIVITWPHVRGARSYAVDVRLGHQTIFRATELSQNRLLLPPASAYRTALLPMYRVEVRAHVGARRIIRVRVRQRPVTAMSSRPS
jgi:hypothetical protein